MTLRRAHRIAKQITREVLQKLPVNLREASAACAIEFALMSECRDDEPDLDEDLLGLFEGCSRLDPQTESPADLPRVRLFLDNLWDYSGGDAAAFREEVRITLLHELGHYLGLDERQVEELGLA